MPLSRCLCAPAAIEPVALDTVLVHSDGVTDNLALDQIADIMKQGPIDECIEVPLAHTVALMAQPDGYSNDTSIILNR